MPGVQKPHWSPCWSQKAFWIGCSTPPEARPSTVRTSWPSACTANIEHDFTARSPSSTITQQPQLDVSQPTCVPVSPHSSRRK